MTTQGAEALYDRLAQMSFSPGWARPEPSMWSHPRLDRAIACWRYEKGRAALDDAAEFVSTDVAERRNLIMVNPAPGNTYATMRTLVAAYQLVASGERARSHRHSPNALRIVIDAPHDTYTVVDGCRVDMAPGDVVLTPAWSWHGHANEGSGPAYWIDFLDVPFVQQIGAMFFEPHPDGFETIKSSNSSSPLRFRMSDTFENGPAREVADGVWVVDLEPNPLPTIGLAYIALAPGAVAGPIQTTASHLYAVVEGSCVVASDAQLPIECVRGDVVAVPAWHRHMLTARDQTVALRVDDAPLLRAVNMLRGASRGLLGAPT